MVGLIVPGAAPTHKRTIIAILASGQTIIAQADGPLWRDPCLIQVQRMGTQQAIAFLPLLMFAAKRDTMPAIPVGTGAVLHVTDPDVDISKTYEKHLVQMRAAASGLIAANSIPENMRR